VLIDDMNTQDSADLLSVIQAVPKIAQESLLPPLRDLMNHPNPGIQSNAILALGKMKDKESRAKIKKLVEDSKQPKVVRTAGVMALDLLE